MSLLVEMTKDSLMNAVQHVIKAVEVNTPVPILAGINIQTRAESITFTASNSSMTIQYTIPRDGITVNIQRTGEVVVPSRYLYDVIRKLNTDLIVLELKEQLILAVMSDHSQIRLCGMDSAEFPSVNYGDQGSPKNGLQINNSVLKSMIKQVALMASTSETRPVLTGVSFTCDQHTLSLIATDGIRLASRTLHIENHANEKIHAIIPAKNLYEVSKMLNHDDETTEIEVSNNRIKFIANGLHMESALIEGTFPSINNVIPQSYLSEIWVDTACLLTAVECVTVLANDNLIRLDANADRLNLLSRTTDIGDIKHDVPLMEMRGEEFVLSLNGKFFVDMLRNLDCASVRIRYTGKSSPIVILPNESLMPALFLITPIRTQR